MKVREAVEVLGGYERMGFGDLELRTSDEEALAEASSTGVYMTRASFVLVVHGIPPLQAKVAREKAVVSRSKLAHIRNQGARSFCGRVMDVHVPDLEGAPDATAAGKMVEQEWFEERKALGLDAGFCAKCRAAYEGTVKREKVADAKESAASLPF